MATIKEISEKANVSIATVSKVLNGKGRVAEQTRQHILDIAKEVNYRPNLYARTLKTKSSKTIGIITEDLTVFNTPEIVDGIAATCLENGYHYILGNLRLYKLYGNGRRDELQVRKSIQETVNHMISTQVDGIIYIGHHSHHVVSPIDYYGLPCVYAYCTSEDNAIPSILYHEEKAAYEATELLLNCEYGNCGAVSDDKTGAMSVDETGTVSDDRTGAITGTGIVIGMVTGIPNSPHSINRVRGFQKALFDHAIPYNPALTFTGDWKRDSGYQGAAYLISQGVNAIFSHNDVMALGIIDYCNDHQITVGKDLFLIGFDNREIASVCKPTLTTVALPLFDIGQTATIQLLDMLQGKAVKNSLTLLDCTIIKRESL